MKCRCASSRASGCLGTTRPRAIGSKRHPPTKPQRRAEQAVWSLTLVQNRPIRHFGFLLKHAHRKDTVVLRVGNRLFVCFAIGSIDEMETTLRPSGSFPLHQKTEFCDGL